MLHRRFRAPILVVAVLTVAISGAGPAGAQTTTTSASEATTATTTTVPVCPDSESVPVIAVFTGEPTEGEDDTLVFEEIDLESGDLRAPVEVAYPSGLPILDDVAVVRVRVVEAEVGLASEVECGGTTGTDDELLEVDDDRLAALGRTAGDLSQRAGRWALFAALGLFAVVAVMTVVRRWRPPLW